MGPEERFGGCGWDRYADNRDGLVPNEGTIHIGLERVDVDQLTSCQYRSIQRHGMFSKTWHQKQGWQR